MHSTSSAAKSTKYAKVDSRVELEFVDRQCVVKAKSRRLLSRSEFAETHVILPMDGGPFQGERFRLDRQPYVKVLYDEIDSGQWSEIYITGPSQSGKTLCAFVVLLLYIVVELRKNLVVGVPDLNMVNDKWQVDIEPVFRANRELEKLLPTTGPGSQGGKVNEYVSLKNGVRLKFMTRGGSDQSKAAFTASHVVVTEAAGFSKSTETSKEADALRQLRARQRATSRYDEDGNLESSQRQMVVEGTVTDEEDLPWRAKSQSSDSRLVCPCVHCGEYIAPEREHFRGWENAINEFEAADNGQFYCPKCERPWTNEQRLEMNSRLKLIHAGQSIDKRGRISGGRPKTSTLFFRWSAFHNLFVRSFDLAADEWKAAQIEPETQEKEEAEKELCQQVWCVPYAAPLIESAPLSRTAVRKRRHGNPPGIVPESTIHLVAGADVGKWTCWYWVMAILETGELKNVIYGSVGTGLDSTHRDSKRHEHVAIESAANEILDMMAKGFALEKGGLLPVDLTLIDAGYMPDAVYAAVRGRDRNKVLAALGRGKTQMDSRNYASPARNSAMIRKIGKRWHLEYDRGQRIYRIVFDADSSKLAIQAALRVEPGQPGSLTLPNAPEKDHINVSRHLCSEVFRRWHEPGKGVKEEWVKSGQNHLLDCAGLSWVAGKIRGWTIPENENEAVENKGHLPSWLA